MARTLRTDDPVSLRRRIGYVFQEAGLFPLHLSAAANIGITPRLLGWSGADIEARTAELLQLVRLESSLASRWLPAQLSGRASASASRWRGLWRRGPGSCCWMSPSAPSIR